MKLKYAKLLARCILDEILELLSNTIQEITTCTCRLTFFFHFKRDGGEWGLETSPHAHSPLNLLTAIFVT